MCTTRVPKQLNITPYVFPVILSSPRLKFWMVQIDQWQYKSRRETALVCPLVIFLWRGHSVFCLVSCISYSLVDYHISVSFGRHIIHLVDLNIFCSLTIFSSLTIQNLVRILLAVERTPRCPLLWIVHHIDVKIDDHKEEGKLYFCCDSSQSTFLPVLQPRIFHLYSSGGTGVCIFLVQCLYRCFFALP